MTLEFDKTTGRFLVVEDGRTALDTDAVMTALIPDASFTLSGYDISFPDFWSGIIYHQTRQGPDAFGNSRFGCSTWVGIVHQEWGPGEASPHNLPDIVLGTVPTGTDYLDCWVNLTRTVNPANIFDLQLAGNFPQGQWVKLEGGSCQIEIGAGVSRLFEIVLSGTNVLLRRYQSTSEGGNASPPVLRNTPGAALGNEVFYFPGTNAPVQASSPARYALYGQKIDEKTSIPSPTHRPSGYEAGSASNVPCSTSKSGISYASTWTGTIRVTPGRIKV